MRSRLYSKYFLFISILFLLAISAAIYILSLNYDSLIAFVVKSIKKNGAEEKIRNQIFTHQRFVLLQRMSWLIFLIAPFCFWLAIRYRYLIMSYYRFFCLSIQQSVKAVAGVFKNNSRQQNREVFALICVSAVFLIYRMVTSFPNYDEMWSYNYYTDNHFYFSFFTYSSYPLFEITTHFFKWLPFPMIVNLRLSPFIFGITSFFLLYACLRKYFNSHFIAMAGLTAFAFMPLTVLFMVNARGVMHEVFFAIAGLFSLLFWVNDVTKKKYLVIYCIAAVLGLYSMTTHALFLLIMLVAGLCKLRNEEKSVLRLFLKINLLIPFCFLLLYAPILFTTGISVFTDVIKQSPSFSNVLNRLPAYMYYMLVDYSGSTYFANILFMLAILILFLLRNRLTRNQQFIFVLAGCLPFSAILFFLATRFPFAGRSLAFGCLSVPLLTCLLALLAEPWFKKHRALKYGLGFSLIISTTLYYNYFYTAANEIGRDVVTVSELFSKNRIASCYDNSDKDSHFFYYYPTIEYYYRLENKTIEFTLSQKNSIRYKPLLTGDKYDCIVYDFNYLDSSRAGSFHELYRDKAGKFKIWIRNDLK